MAEPIRSDALAGLLQFILGGEGSAYSLPLGNKRGAIVLANRATPDALEHERMHIDAGFNKERNQTIDLLANVKQPAMPRGAPAMAPMSPDAATRLMNQQAELRMRALQSTIHGLMGQGYSAADATRAAHNLLMKGGR